MPLHYNLGRFCGSEGLICGVTGAQRVVWLFQRHAGPRLQLPARVLRTDVLCRCEVRVLTKKPEPSARRAHHTWWALRPRVGPSDESSVTASPPPPSLPIARGSAAGAARDADALARS